MKLEVYNFQDIENIDEGKRKQYTEIEIMEEIVLPKNCSKLFLLFVNVEKIKGLNKLDTSKVTNMRFMFAGCCSLTTLDLRSFDTSNVTDTSFMFVLCESLKTLDLSNFKTSNMSYIFSGCNPLIALDWGKKNFNKINKKEQNDNKYSWRNRSW